MKHILNFSSYIKENNSNPSMGDLEKFYKDLMSGNTQIQKHHRNYKIDSKDVREMVQTIVYTPELLAELKRRKVETPDISKMKLNIEKTQYHRVFKYELSDITDEKFSISVDIQVPFDEEFEDDNTMITASIFLKNRGRLKLLHGYANKRAQKDNEFNKYSIGEVIQKAYQDLINQM